MGSRNRPDRTPQRTPRSPLQQARFDRGWSQQQVVDRVRAICPGHRNREPCRMDVAKLSDFERQVRRPSVTHIEAFARLYGRSPEELGLLVWRDQPEDEPEQAQQEEQEEDPPGPLAFLVIPIGRGGLTWKTALAALTTRHECEDASSE